MLSGPLTNAPVSSAIRAPGTGDAGDVDAFFGQGFGFFVRAFAVDAAAAGFALVDAPRLLGEIAADMVNVSQQLTELFCVPGSVRIAGDRGIYIDFNLLVGRPFKAGDGVEDANQLREGAKGTSLFDKRIDGVAKGIFAGNCWGIATPTPALNTRGVQQITIIEINNENALNIGYRAIRLKCSCHLVG